MQGETIILPDVETDFTHLVNEALPCDDIPISEKEKRGDAISSVQRRCQSARPARDIPRLALPLPVVSLKSGGDPTLPKLYNNWAHASFDAIKAVSRANNVEESRPRKKVLNATYLTFAMDANQKPNTNYMKRNQTTHQWSQIGGSNSFPNSPNRSMSASFEVRPAGIKYQQANRPSSAYTYGGGIFVAKPKRDYFVIHPEWVSESMTIQKLSLNDRQTRPRTPSARPSRRCRSAPPPKLRNPITWEKAAD